MSRQSASFPGARPALVYQLVRAATSHLLDRPARSPQLAFLSAPRRRETRTGSISGGRADSRPPVEQGTTRLLVGNAVRGGGRGRSSLAASWAWRADREAQLPCFSGPEPQAEVFRGGVLRAGT